MDASQLKDMEKNAAQVVLILWKQFGRKPTEQEVVTALFGSKEQRKAMWDNKGSVL